MINEIKRNELRWIMPYELSKKYATDEMALELVNSENRKIIVNGFYLVSQNESDLQYIKELFPSVRIKIGYVNSIKFYGIEYATNYSETLGNAKYILNENLKQQFERRFIKFEDLILNNKTIEDLKEAENFIEKYHEKVSKRSSQKRFIDNLVTIKRTAKDKLKEKILLSHVSYKDKYGYDVYLKDGVIYTK